MADIDLTTALFAMAEGYESDKDKKKEGAASPHHSSGSRSPRSPRLRSQSRSRSPYHSPRHSRSRSLQSYRNRSYSRSPAAMSHREKPSGRQRRDESVEEGEEVSGPGSPGSLGSGAMDESDSESDGGRGASPNEHDPLAREQRLADIAEQADERERMDQLKGLFDDRTKPTKRKLDAYDDEPKRNIRQRTSLAKKDEPSSRSRTAKKTRQSEFSDGDSDSGVKKADPVAQLMDYQRVRIGRSNFPQVCFDPYFEDRIAGCFVRVAFNRDPTTGENIYRMCEIRSIKSGKPYQMEGVNGKLLMTDQYLVTGYGKIEKEYPLLACSDSKFTDVEFDRWKHAITDAHLRQLTISKIKAKIDDINFLLKHDWTSADIQQKLDNQSRLAHLIRHTRKVAVGPETMRREEQLHQRNLENRRQNAKDVHEALLRERREKKARHDKARKAMEEEERRKQDPEAEAKYLEEQEKKRIEKEAMQKSIQKRYVKDAESYKKGGALTEFARMRTDDEVIGSLDLDIDIDIC